MKRMFTFILVIGIFICCFLSIDNLYANSSSTDNFFVGYSSNMSRDELKESTNTIRFTDEEYNTNNFPYQRTIESTSEESPMITVLTHGYGAAAKHWSNDYSFFCDADKQKNKVRRTDFCYDPDSMIERLREVTNGEVFLAEMKSPTSFTLFKLQLTKVDEFDNTISLIDNYKNAKESFKNKQKLFDSEFESIKYSLTYENVTAINDISKHIIIVFNSSKSSGLNNYVYEEFDYMMDKIVYDVKSVNNGILPKINLISHSRGGITNLQYTMEHPDLVDSICTLGSPFLGSHLGQSEYILNFMDYTSTNPSDGVSDITNESVYNGYKNRWNKYYNELYSNVNFHAIGGYSSIDFLNYMIINDDFLKNHDLELLPAIFTHINSCRLKENIAVMLGKAAQFISFEGDAEKIRYAIELICDNICIDSIGDALYNRLSIRDDLFIHLDSQLAVGYRGVTQYAKKFKAYNTDLTKLSVADVAIVHNLEARDAELIDYTIKNMRFSGGNNNQYITEEKADGTLILKGAYFLNSSTNQIIIPSSINGKTVSEIGNNAFSNLTVADNINEIIIPSTIKKIGVKSFYNCTFIETINFEPGSLLNEISECAFSLCLNLRSINLPSTTTKISSEAFNRCISLNSLILPSNLTIFEVDAFSNCISLNKLELASSNNIFKVVDNVLYSKDETKLVFYPCGKYDSSYTVSHYTSEILAGAITDNMYINSIDLSNTKVLRSYSIYNCENLNNVTGATIESVYEGALSQTPWLNNKITNVILGTCLVKYNQSDTQISEEELYNVKSIGSDAFYNSNITDIVIPSHITQINSSAFNFSQNLNKVVILGNTYIFNNAFDYVSNNLNIYVRYDLYEEYISNATLNEYADKFKVISTNVTLVDESTTNQVLNYGEAYSLPLSDINGNSIDWRDQYGNYYKSSGIWTNLNTELVLTASIHENVKFIDENGSVLYQCNLLNGDSYHFENNNIYINGAVVYTLNVPQNYYQYEFYINNIKVVSGTYNTSFSTIIVKENPITYTVSIYRFNPYHSENQSTEVKFTHQDIIQNGIKYFYSGDYDKYLFEGLFINSTKTTQLIDPFEIINMYEKVLYTKWSIRTFEVTYYFNDDSNLKQTIIVSALDNHITLPTPDSSVTKEHYYANAWKIHLNNNKYDFGLEYEVVANTEFNLDWNLINYSLFYENLNGANNLNSLYYTYGMSFSFSIPILSGHSFKGWYLDNNFTTKINKINNTDSGEKILYAKWEKTASSSIRSDEVIITDDGIWTQHYDEINIKSMLGFSAQELYDKGYKTINLTLNMKIWELNDGYQHIYLYNGITSNSKVLYKIENMEYGGTNKETKKQTCSFSGITIFISDLLSSDAIYVRYNAGGYFADDWGNCELSVSMSTTQSSTYLHDYSYTSLGSAGHVGHCSCGHSTKSPHVINPSSTGERYVKCLFCNYVLDLLVDTGIVLSYSLNNQYKTENGSYILPSGVIVLVEEDKEKYINGTLIFKDNIM